MKALQKVFVPVDIPGATGNYIPTSNIHSKVFIVKEQYEMDKDWEALVEEKEMIIFTKEEFEEFLKTHSK